MLIASSLFDAVIKCIAGCCSCCVMIEAWDACQEVLHAYIVHVVMDMQLREEQTFLSHKLVRAVVHAQLRACSCKSMQPGNMVQG